MASFSDNLPTFETWSLHPPFHNSWISEADAITKALQQTISAGVFKPDTPPSFPALSVSSSGGGYETETVSKPATQNHSAPPTARGKIAKRRSRASKRSPTTFITADPANFRQMVQQVTGVQFPDGSVVKPEPQGTLAGCHLPTLDTSAFLVDHQQVQAVKAEAGGSGSLDNIDGYSGFRFPTLESWCGSN